MLLASKFKILFLIVPQICLAEMTKPMLATCPFCQPDFQDVPNLQSALKGYDLPNGDPDRK